MAQASLFLVACAPPDPFPGTPDPPTIAEMGGAYFLMLSHSEHTEIQQSCAWL